jgi:biotin operon repressor
VPRVPNQSKQDAAEEIAMLSQTFGYDGDGKESPGFFVGMLRGTNLVQAREKAPDWVMDSAMLREFAETQSDAKRAATVLYLFYVCGQPDSEIAYDLGCSESAVTKYRQRLKRAGDAFAAEKLKAA